MNSMDVENMETNRQYNALRQIICGIADAQQIVESVPHVGAIGTRAALQGQLARVRQTALELAHSPEITGPVLEGYRANIASQLVAAGELAVKLAYAPHEVEDAELQVMGIAAQSLAETIFRYLGMK